MSDHQLPPWVMARVDDIPQKFLSSPNLVNSPTIDNVDSPELAAHDGEEMKQELGSSHGRVSSKVAALCSKFGTYLEPVSEEVEVSSQGTSATLITLTTPRDTSFESNRSSTLKADS